MTINKVKSYLTDLLSTDAATAGEVRIDSSTEEFKYHGGTAEQTLAEFVPGAGPLAREGQFRINGTSLVYYGGGAEKTLTTGGGMGYISGSFTANGADNRTVTTSVPVGATLVSIETSQTASNITDHWHVGDAANHEQRGTSGNARYVNGTTRFAISGLNFIVGSLGSNQGGGAVGWTVIYKEA